jgi:acetylglutamate/LysW-gamma-L-alpha-aminoadipate kinase
MIVVKIGGAQGIGLQSICADVAKQKNSGQDIIIVHGGSAETNEISTKLGYPPRFVTAVSGFTSRYTDRNTLEIFAMVTAGKINKLLVECLQKAGVNAFGFSGIDGRIMTAKRKEAIRIVENGRQIMLRDDYTGKIEEVNGTWIKHLVAEGFTPVIAPLAISFDGDALNVDADRAAAMVAGAIGAEKLLLLTNVPGLLRNFPDTATLIPHINREGLDTALSFAEGRMKKKVLGACEALDLGVSQVIFADARVDNPIASALAGQGTVID